MSHSRILKIQLEIEDDILYATSIFSEADGDEDTIELPEDYKIDWNDPRGSVVCFVNETYSGQYIADETTKVLTKLLVTP